MDDVIPIDINNQIKQCINSIISPLKTIIFTYMPENIQMRLCINNRSIQSQLKITILTYKYHHLLSRQIPIEYNKVLHDFCNKLKLHHIKVSLDKLSKASLLKRFLTLKKKYSIHKEKDQDLNNALELYLMDYKVSYLIIANEEEYALFNSYSRYFQETKLFLVDIEEGKDIIKTFIKNNKPFGKNIIFIKTKQIHYLDYHNYFPNMIYLSRKSYSYYPKECDYFNISHNKLSILDLYLWKRDNLSSVHLTQLKHLSIKLGKYAVESALQHDNHSPLNINIPFLNNTFEQLISLSIYQTYYYDENMAAIKLSLTSATFPILQHLHIKVNKLNVSPIIDLKTLKTIALKTNFSSKVTMIVSKDLEYFDCQYTNSNLQLEFNEGEYHFKKFKTSSSIGLINTTFPLLIHLHLYITDQEWPNLKEFMEKIAFNIISLKLNWYYITNSQTINDLFYYEFSSLKKLKVNFPMDLEQKVFDFIMKKIPIVNLTTIVFHFSDNTECSISDKIMENLMKYPLNHLELLVCNNLSKSLKIIIQKKMPSLKKLSLSINNLEQGEVFESFDIIYPFFKNNHSKLECLSLYNNRFKSYANYSLALYPRLYSFHYSKENDVSDSPISFIEKNNLYEKRQCLIF